MSENSPNDSPRSLLERSRNLRRHSPASALQLLLRATRLAPEDHEIAAEVQYVRRELHTLFRTIEDLEQRVALVPGVPAIWLELAEALLKVDRDEDALTAYDHALVPDPHNVEILARKGNLLNNMSDYEEALEVFARLRELAPDWSFPWTMAGTVLCNLRRYPDAVPYLERAVAINSRDIGGWAMLGLAFSVLGRQEEAREARKWEREARLASEVPAWMPRD